MKIKCFLFKILYLLYKNEFIEWENNINTAEKKIIKTSYVKFYTFYIMSEKVKNQKVWLVFFIDNRVKIYTSIKLNIAFEVKSLFWISKRRLEFLPESTIYIPKSDHKKKRFIFFLFNELNDYKLTCFTILLISIFLYIEKNYNIIDRLIDINIMITTIFISIYLVLFALNFNKPKDDVNEYFSGVYHVKYEFNKNIFYAAILNLTICILLTIIRSVDFSRYSNSIIIILRKIGRYNFIASLTAFSYMITYICQFNIIKYYLQVDKEEYYNRSIEKILSDQIKKIEEFEENSIPVNQVINNVKDKKTNNYTK